MWQAFLHQPSLFRTPPQRGRSYPLLPPFPPALKGGGGGSNYNTHIVQYLQKQRELENEIWSTNRTQHGKYLS